MENSIDGGYFQIDDHRFLFDCLNKNITVITAEMLNGVTCIGHWAFENCTGLKSINIPNGVASIGDWAFQNCKALESINIPNSVTYIGNMAFKNCTSLKSINIPNSVNFIGDWAFQNCTALTSINIPNHIKTIGDGTFSFCKCLKSINIPNSVTSIGYDAFEDCTSLESMTIDDKKYDVKMINGCLMTIDSTEKTDDKFKIIHSHEIKIENKKIVFDAQEKIIAQHGNIFAFGETVEDAKAKCRIARMKKYSDKFDTVKLLKRFYSKKSYSKQK